MEIITISWLVLIFLCLPTLILFIRIIIQQRKELKDLKGENEELKTELRGIVKNTIGKS